MLRLLSIFVLIMLTTFSSWAQGVTAVHEVKEGSLPNEFSIKTTISGLEGVDLARIKYFISKKHTYKKSSNNTFFSKVEDDYIKFYILSIPNNGIVVVELGVVLASEGSFTFPVEFQYSKNEEKIVFEGTPLIIDNNTSLIVVEATLNEKTQAENDAAALLAATQAEDVRKKKEEQDNLAKKEANQLAEEQAKTEAAALALAEQQKIALAAKEKEDKRIVEASSGVKYGVQLFALSKYTEQKIRDFCKRNNLDYALISTLETKGITKVRYGSVNSKTEAEALKKELLTRPQINGGFVVKVFN